MFICDVPDNTDNHFYTRSVDTNALAYEADFIIMAALNIQKIAKYAQKMWGSSLIGVINIFHYI